MERYEIHIGVTYTSNRWRGARKVTDVVRHRGQDAVVHFKDLRTERNGNAPLSRFAQSAAAMATVQA